MVCSVNRILNDVECVDARNYYRINGNLAELFGRGWLPVRCLVVEQSLENRGKETVYSCKETVTLYFYRRQDTTKNR